MDTLKKGWKREYGIGHVLVVRPLHPATRMPVADLRRNCSQTVKCLFIVPNPESALDEEAGKLLLEEYDSYFKVRSNLLLDAVRWGC